MPAGPSCPIPPGLARLCDASPLQEAEPSHLLVYLAAVPDPRGALGRRPPRVPPRRPGHPGHPQAPVGVPHASTPSSRRLPEGEERFDLRTPYFALSSRSSGETLVSTAVGPYSHGGSHGPPSTSRRIAGQLSETVGGLKGSTHHHDDHDPWRCLWHAPCSPSSSRTRLGAVAHRPVGALDRPRHRSRAAASAALLRRDRWCPYPLSRPLGPAAVPGRTGGDLPRPGRRPQPAPHRHRPRAPHSSISREVARNGGRDAYRAHDADTAAYARAKRPKTSKLAASPALRVAVERGLSLE